MECKDGEALTGFKLEASQNKRLGFCVFFFGGTRQALELMTYELEACVDGVHLACVHYLPEKKTYPPPRHF